MKKKVFKFAEYSVTVTEHIISYSKFDECFANEIIMPIAGGNWNNTITEYGTVILDNGYMRFKADFEWEYKQLFDFIALGYGIDVPAKPILTK
jgi:hypothetical protein